MNGIGSAELLVILFGLLLAVIPVGLAVLILLALRAVRAEQVVLLQTVQAIQRDMQRTPPGPGDPQLR